jgi:mono/diheme cytochrome c family protein
VRATTLAAGGLACAGAAMTIAAFAGGGERTTPTAASPTPAATRDGLAVWVANGCGSCHTFAPANANAPIGPDLMLSLHDKDREYIERAILAPNEDAPSGYVVGGMPDDYATRISPPDLHLLIDFIHDGVAAQ